MTERRRRLLQWTFRSFLIICAVAISVYVIYRGRWALLYAVTGKARAKLIKKPPEHPGQEPIPIIDDKTSKPKHRTVDWNGKERLIWFALFLIACCPMSMCLGFLVAGSYYIHKYVKLREQKKVEEAKRRLSRLPETKVPVVVNPDPVPQPRQSVQPPTATPPIPTITISSTRYEDIPSSLPEPVPKRTSVGFRQSAAKYYEDMRYKWTPNPGYIGTEQRHTNFQSDEKEGFQMAELKGGNGSDTLAPRGANLNATNEDGGNTKNGRGGNRNTAMTEFPMLF
ncbi:unnamed protein product [Periconia digitata]|uniref:Transmembrane protein n=1 Tax=Periconia digitata TaxID=1303443 RepID=A0A9W4XTS2_9PLEO|nr:unnamed protein product [Periconia digitata]